MRMHWTVWAAPLVLLAAGTAAGETHTDETLGYSFNVPEGYRAIPVAGQEEYVVAKWQSEREYADPKEGWSHRVEIKVILFDPKGKPTEEKGKDSQGVGELTRVKNPYRNFKDWLKSDATGGRHISKEEPVEVGGVKATWYEVAFEKLTVPRRGLAYVYHTGDVEYCISTEMLEHLWDKLSPPLFRALKSFKALPRRGAVKRETDDANSAVQIMTADISKLSPEERYQRRQANFEKGLRIATERLTDGWYVKRSKNYVALSHTDERYTKVILDLAEEVRKWAEKNLGFYGTGIAGSEMIRICKDSAEESAFRDVSSRSAGWSNEITIARDDQFSGQGRVANRIFERWLHDKNPRLDFGAPPWLTSGLSQWIETAYVKENGQLYFRPDISLIRSLAVAAKTDKLILPREMLLASSSELYKRAEAAEGPSGPGGMPDFATMYASPYMQTAGFVRYLLDGPGRTNPRTKELLRNYVRALDDYLTLWWQNPTLEAGSAPKAPQTEEEEDERFRKGQELFKGEDRQKKMLQDVFDQVFKDWTDADWKALATSFKKYASN